MKQSKALFICILLVSVRRLISAQTDGTAYLVLFILPKYTWSEALENMPVINSETPLIKQLKHGHKNSLRKTLIFVSSLHGPMSCLPAPEQNLSACWVKAGIAEVCPSKRVRVAEPSERGGRGDCSPWLSSGWLAKPPHAARTHNSVRMTCHL